MVQKDTALDILEKLIAFETISDRSNLYLIAWVESYLTDLGATTHRVPSADGRKSSLFALIGPNIPGGIILSGHTDVVPIAGQDWDTDPFKLTRKEDRLHGRGSVDMKGFLACVLGSVPV